MSPRALGLRVTGRAAPLLRDDVDTDAIIPSREMTGVTKDGFAAGLFAGWRYRTIGGRDADDTFVLNRPEYAGASVLLAGANFGCGSSREHAVWALAEYGFRAIVAPSFAPIFEGNCVRNGIVPVRLPAEAVRRLAETVTVDPAVRPVTVDLEALRVTAPPGFEAPFPLEAEAQESLIHGLDPIALTERHAAAIARFRARDRVVRPWIYLPGDAP
jgi:3-isopropylmalate/(R)-2-methylmalate dehydratase small subunit